MTYACNVVLNHARRYLFSDLFSVKETRIFFHKGIYKYSFSKNHMVAGDCAIVTKLVYILRTISLYLGQYTEMTEMTANEVYDGLMLTSYNVCISECKWLYNCWALSQLRSTKLYVFSFSS